MSLVNGDPEEIRAFAKTLETFCDETLERLSRVRSLLTEMGTGSWTDSRYQEYAEMFEGVETAVRQAVGRIQPEHPTYLREAAKRLEEYLEG